MGFQSLYQIAKEIARLERKCKCSTVGIYTIEGTEPDLTKKNSFQILDDRTVFVGCDETVIEFTQDIPDDTNLFTSDLTLTEDRNHDGNGFAFNILNLSNLNLEVSDGLGSLSRLELELENAGLISEAGGETSVVRVAPSDRGVVLADTNGRYWFWNGAPFLPVEDVPDKALGVKSDGQIVTYDVLDVDNLREDQIVLNISGGGSVITTGFKGYVQVPYSGTIHAWTVAETSETPITSDFDLDVWVSASYPPTSGDSVWGALARPQLGSQILEESMAPGDVVVSAGNWIGFEVLGVTDAENIFVALKITKD